MKKCIQVLMLVMVITGCSSNNPYPITESIVKINEKQILDPMAPENNEGVVNALNGNYGENVITDYQKSNSKPTEGQTGKSQSLIAGGSGG